MSATINLKVQLGPLVSIEVAGNNCDEITEALKGYDALNSRIDCMCGDMAERIYPDCDSSQNTEKPKEAI